MDAASIIAILASIIGPLIGVMMADMFAKRNARQQETAELFRRIMEDSLLYVHTFNECWQFRRQILQMQIEMTPTDDKEYRYTIAPMTTPIRDYRV